MVRLRNISPVGDLDVELLRGYLPERVDEDGATVSPTVVRRGEEFEVPEEIAGQPPGQWRSPTPEELADGGLAGLATRRPVDQPGPVEVLDPGSGLLAQVSNFEAVVAAKTPVKAPEATAPKEG